MQRCPFCRRIAEGDYDQALASSAAVSFPPLKPVTPGHLLVVSRQHVEHAGVDGEVSAEVMRLAAAIVTDQGKHCNLITSIGDAATQTVAHLHMHVVPRFYGDGLALPWTVQR